MKNKLYVLVLFFCASTILATPVKVALLGDRNRCDILVAELSSDTNIELLERTEINKILTEHQLNENELTAGTMAKYFSHTDIFAFVSEKRLVVFNAKNGFRLYDGKAENTGKVMSLAIQKMAIKEPLCLSIVAVRDVGVPRRLKPKIEETVELLEQRLMLYPEIQMLERARLGVVADERVISGKQFALASSARLLTLEFAPGSEVEIINVKILIHNLERKEIGRLKFSYAVKDIDETVANLSEQIFALLINRTAVVANVSDMKEHCMLSLNQSDYFFTKHKEGKR